MSLVFITLDDYKYHPEAVQILKSNFKDVIIARSREQAFNELKAYQNRCTALIIGIKEGITRQFLHNLPNLKIVGTLTVGTDHIDVEALQEHGISFITAKGINANSVAEHALMMILSLFKSSYEFHHSVLGGKDRDGHKKPPIELKKKKVGILGAGAIANAVIKLLIPFDCEISLWTRNFINHSSLFAQGIKYKEIDEIFASSEIVTLHLPLTRETRGIVDYKRIMSMPKDCLLINVSRINLFNINDLKMALQNRPDIRIGIDDFNIQKILEIPLLKNQCVFSPHIAGCSKEALNEIKIYIAKQVVQMIQSSKQNF